jgi:hypothetical protein
MAHPMFYVSGGGGNSIDVVALFFGQSTAAVSSAGRALMAMPPAAVISVRATLAMLDGPKREIADGVANDQYVFWLGSGISRERMPDLGVSKRVDSGHLPTSYAASQKQLLGFQKRITYPRIFRPLAAGIKHQSVLIAPTYMNSWHIGRSMLTARATRVQRLLAFGANWRKRQSYFTILFRR